MDELQIRQAKKVASFGTLYGQAGPMKSLFPASNVSAAASYSQSLEDTIKDLQKIMEAQTKRHTWKLSDEIVYGYRAAPKKKVISRGFREQWSDIIELGKKSENSK